VTLLFSASSAAASASDDVTGDDVTVTSSLASTADTESAILQHYNPIKFSVHFVGWLNTEMVYVYTCSHLLLFCISNTFTPSCKQEVFYDAYRIHQVRFSSAGELTTLPQNPSPFPTASTPIYDASFSAPAALHLTLGRRNLL